MTTSLVGNSTNTFATAAPTAAQAAATTDQGKLNEGFDQFLLLLTTQLKNQDPMSPMESNEFTNQLVAFSGVEQQIKANENISKLVEMTKSSETTLGLSYIGLNVNTDSSDFKYYGTGPTETSYTLPENAGLSKITILDENQNIVYSQDGELAAGKHTFTWDGLDNNGAQAPAGLYSLRVGALDSQQKSINVSTVVPGRVEGIETTDNGEVMLIVNDKKVPMTAIQKATL